MATKAAAISKAKTRPKIDLHSELKNRFGFKEFKDEQEQII